MIAALFAVAALLAEATPAAAPQAAPAASPNPISGVTVPGQAAKPKPKPRDDLVCEQDAVIGSKLRKTVCLPRSYVELRERNAHVAVERMTTGGPVLDPTGGGH